MCSYAHDVSVMTFTSYLSVVFEYFNLYILIYPPLPPARARAAASSLSRARACVPPCSCVGDYFYLVGLLAAHCFGGVFFIQLLLPKKIQPNPDSVSKDSKKTFEHR